jgi:hypothetical protein
MHRSQFGEECEANLEFFNAYLARKKAAFFKNVAFNTGFFQKRHVFTSKFLNKVRTKLLGALLVATGLLSTMISFFLKLGKKFPSYEPKSYAQIWVQAKNFRCFLAHNMNIIY